MHAYWKRAWKKKNKRLCLLPGPTSETIVTSDFWWLVCINICLVYEYAQFECKKSLALLVGGTWKNKEFLQTHFLWPLWCLWSQPVTSMSVQCGYQAGKICMNKEAGDIRRKQSWTNQNRNQGVPGNKWKQKCNSPKLWDTAKVVLRGKYIAT